jgi:predicted metal-dependent hydrolase
LVGIEEFNRGQFFECHETLEELWMAEPGPIRQLYQGILQIGVAFYHLKAGRYRPVVTLLVQGSGYLQPFAPVCMGVDVALLLADAARCLDEVRRLGPDDLDMFDPLLIPSIEMSGDK